MKVLSLDCWGTLIEARPSFWQEYASIVKEVTSSGLTTEKISGISKQVNAFYDTLSKANGVAYSQVERLYRLLLSVVSSPNSQALDKIIRSIIAGLDIAIVDGSENFIILDDKIAETLKECKKNKQVVVLSSNTGFISGNQTTQILRDLGLDYFDSRFYSDVIGFPKPSAMFIQEILNYYRADGGVDRIIHIGDDNY